jgi:hypothetical protein
MERGSYVQVRRSFLAVRARYPPGTSAVPRIAHYVMIQTRRGLAMDFSKKPRTSQTYHSSESQSYFRTDPAPFV